MGFRRPMNLSRSIPQFRIAQRGDVGCILMHLGSVTVHQDAPYTVGVALGPDLRREERDKELAFVGVAWCIVDARYGLLCSVG